MDQVGNVESQASGMSSGCALVATDGSPSAIAAARAALTILGSDHVVNLVTIVPPAYDPSQDAGGFEGPVMTEEEARREHQSDVVEANASLAETAEATRPDLHSEVISSERSVADTLVELAEQRQAAVIVVGHEQHGLLHDLFLGSVAERLVRHARCPVLVVPEISSP